MAGEEAAEGSRRRRHSRGINLYVDLPPLPRPRVVRLATSVASPTLMLPNSTGAAPEAPRTVAAEPENDGSACGCNANFECNICLDVAKKPVVTACGHLFCWPCLYRWLYAESRFPECPVCKGEVLDGNITPIYGRGSEDEGDSTAASTHFFLPPRPRANRRESLRQQQQPQPQMAVYDDVTQIASMIRELIRNQGLPTPAAAGMTSVNDAQVVLATPQQPSSVEQQSTSSSSTAAAIVTEPGPSRRSRRPSDSETPTIRSTRRRPQ